MTGINILIAGVGGQGTLLASKVLGFYAQMSGFDCKLSEVHGMAQRGGSVVTYVKMGKKVYSPVIEQGEADILLAFEKIEAARFANYLKKGGIIIASTQEIMPMSVLAGGEKYPFGILETLLEKGYNVIKAAAADIALEAGNIKAANIALLGFLSKAANFDKAIMKEAVRMSVPKATAEINLKAFEMGYQNYL
jgi:indolepyruvate ferredoxin oxidoreductase beta subunit